MQHTLTAEQLAKLPEWAADFTIFLQYVGRRPTPEHSIDRIHNNGHYEPGNVRWATRQQQAENRSTVRFYMYRGTRDSIAGWARRTGIPYLRLRRRLVSGWPVARALEGKDAAVRAALPAKTERTLGPPDPPQPGYKGYA